MLRLHLAMTEYHLKGRELGEPAGAQKKGQAVTFCSSEENEILAEIESFPNKEITVMGIDKTLTAKRLILPKTRITTGKS